MPAYSRSAALFWALAAEGLVNVGELNDVGKGDGSPPADEREACRVVADLSGASRMIHQ